MNSYPAGSSVKCRALFYSDVDRTTAADPTSVIFRFRDPDGNLTTHMYGVDGALIKSATGDYYDLVATDESGVWQYEFEGTGAVDIVLPGKFQATPSLAAE